MLPTASTSTREMGRTPPARHSSARPASGSIAVCSVCVRVRVGAGLVAHHVHLRLHVSRLPFWYRRKLLQECLVERVNPIAVHAASVGVSQTKPEDCDVGQPALPDGGVTPGVTPGVMIRCYTWCNDSALHRSSHHSALHRIPECNVGGVTRYTGKPV